MIKIDKIWSCVLRQNIMIKTDQICNSNWTEWSTIQGVIARVIQNRTSAKREADLKLRARFEIGYPRARAPIK